MSTLNSQFPLNAGDTLQSLAQQYLGDYTKWRELADVNNLDIFQNLPIGEQIQIPSQQQLETIAQERLGQLTGQLQELNSPERIQQLLEQGISSLDLPELDLSSLKKANPYGKLPWQLVSWLL